VTAEAVTRASTEVMPYDAPRPAWLKARKSGLGGSDASKACGVNAYDGPLYVYLDKLGLIPEIPDNPAMRFGRKLEPVVREVFTEDTGIGIRLAGLQRNNERPWQLYSPDGFADDGGLFEAKTTGWWNRDEWSDDQTADHAEIQVQHGMAVTGAPHAWVAVLIDGRDFQFRRVERDEDQIAMITEIERKLWFDHILKQVPPAPLAADLDVVKSFYKGPDPSKITMASPAEAAQLIREWNAAKQNVKSAETAAALAEAKLRVLVGNGHALQVTDKVVLTAKPTGTFAASRFRDENPELADALTIPSIALDMDRLKAEHPDVYTKYRSRVLRLTKEGTQL
jgi:putative phage-type endonuclease